MFSDDIAHVYINVIVVLSAASSETKVFISNEFVQVSRKVIVHVASGIDENSGGKVVGRICPLIQK